MNIGPVEMLVVKFPGNQFRGEIVPALEELTESGTVRIIDLVFIIKDEYGSVEGFEYQDWAREFFDRLTPVLGEMNGLLTEDDVTEIAGLLEPNSSAALMLFENVWATRFRDAIANAQGQVVLLERIPRQVVQEVLDMQATS